jgi:riboflavin synthase
MFTGIVAELGEVSAVDEVPEGRRLTIAAASTLDRLGVGDSVAVNGVCLTVTERSTDTFSVEAVRETLERTTIGELESGSPVNLERPMPADGRFDGHIVQGHVDGVGVVRSIIEEGDASRVRIEIPSDLARYVVEKGSITIDGTSLTVTAISDQDVADHWLEIVLIPHTLEVTVFGLARRGTTVNLEVDVIAKYVERMMGPDR